MHCEEEVSFDVLSYGAYSNLQLDTSEVIWPVNCGRNILATNKMLFLDLWTHLREGNLRDRETKMIAWCTRVQRYSENLIVCAIPPNQTMHEHNRLCKKRMETECQTTKIVQVQKKSASGVMRYIKEIHP